jgi:hypothetical protein
MDVTDDSGDKKEEKKEIKKGGNARGGAAADALIKALRLPSGMSRACVCYIHSSAPPNRFFSECSLIVFSF